MRSLTIYILDDDPLSLSMVSEIINVGFPGATLKTFTDHRAFLDAPDLCLADLYIIDIHLESIDGRDLPDLMPDDCKLRPFLFVSGYPVEDEALDILGGLVAFEFISKPFNLRQFLHRVGLLMEVCPVKPYPVNDIFDLMMNSPLVVVVIDDAGRVRYCNQQAAVFFGFTTAAEMIGQEAAVFGFPVGKGAARQGDYIGQVITITGDEKEVRWLVTPFEGEANRALKLMIGIPYQMELDMVDKIRRLWRERIRLDKAAIKALKPIAPLTVNSCKVAP